jgi:hypothetical protein
MPSDWLGDADQAAVPDVAREAARCTLSLDHDVACMAAWRSPSAAPRRAAECLSFDLPAEDQPCSAVLRSIGTPVSKQGLEVAEHPAKFAAGAHVLQAA